MGIGGNDKSEASARPRTARAWHTAALGGGLVIGSVMVGHAFGIPLSSAGSVEAHVPAVPAAPQPEFAVAYPAMALADPQPAPEVPDAGVRRFTGEVGADLSASLTAAGVPEAQGREYVAVLGRAIPIARELSVADRFDLVIERNPDGSYGRLLYAGMDRIARADVELLKWTDGKTIIWVNGDGVGGESNAAMGRPVDGRVTSGFGTRFHPILGTARMHKGVDLAARHGTPIVAAADGQVVAAGWHGGYGQQVILAHGDGLQSTYGHMSRIAAAAGASVRRGQIIGYVGSTGLSTGPHLHFEVKRNGRPVNPLSVKFASGPAQLQGPQLRAFQDQLRQVLMAPSKG